jgi:Fic family protein
MNPMQSSAGKTLKEPEGYLAFHPNPLPPHPAFALDEEGVLALANADHYLGQLAGKALSIPNPDLFVGMYVRREAILSSEIENISCTLDEVLQYEAEEDHRGHNKDVEQVVKYVKAFNEGLKRLPQEKLGASLLKDLHGILLEGEAKGNPGVFRPKQNWIGREGQTAFEAQFVPPPEQQMYQSLANLEYFINEHQSPMPPLVRCALVHAQFETIHPFSDGNGRIGRLLIALMLSHMKKLEKPLLYLSLFLLENKREYYELLMRVRSHGDWLSWVKFMLSGVERTAKDAVAVCEKLQVLQREMDARAADAPKGLELMNVLYQYPVITAGGLRQHLGGTLATAISRLRRFEALGIVRETTGQKRGRVYRFDRYVDTLDDGWSARKAATETNRKVTSQQMSSGST